MADVVDIRQIASGPRNYITRLLGQLDTADEAAVVKIDISTFTDANGKTCTYTAIDRIDFVIGGNLKQVLLAWDHTTDDEIALLAGQGTICPKVPLVDPRSAGGTGDIVLTTLGAADDGSYDITIHWRPKA